jgi:hypothetical protein
MRIKKAKSKTDKNRRIVNIPCIECGRKLLKFHIENETVIDGEGVIAMNFPGAVCPDCIDAVLGQVADPPGLVCIKNLNPMLAKEFIESFDFLLHPSQAVDFFLTLFMLPVSNGYIAERNLLREPNAPRYV